MAIKLKEYPLSNINDFDKICGHLVRFVRKTWNWKGIAPIKKEDKEENRTFWKEALEGYDGPDASGVRSYPAHERLTASYVEYEADHGRDPLNALISASIAYGMIVEKERQERVINFNLNKEIPTLVNSLLIAAKNLNKDGNVEDFKRSVMIDLSLYLGIHNYDNSFEMNPRHDTHNVARWEDDPKGMAEKEAKDYTEINAMMDKLLEGK